MRILALLTFVAWALLSSKVGAQEQIVLSTEDVSRGELGEMAAAEIEPATKGVGIPFTFPDNRKASFVYGIDLSHHSFKKGVIFDWPSFDELGIIFVYVKATQGEQYIDGTFTETWKTLKENKKEGGFRRGAYHFLTAGGDSQKQAVNFLALIKAAGGFVIRRDMPPVVDLEWDCKIVRRKVVLDKNGRCVDLWDGVPSKEIIEKVIEFSDLVESQLGVRPIIYTADSWWKERGLGDGLPGRKLWIADYTNSAQKKGKPRSPNGYRISSWQFTDNAVVHSLCVPTDKKKKDFCNDANVYMGDFPSFLAEFGLDP